jgi:hypothetical protein
MRRMNRMNREKPTNLMTRSSLPEESAWRRAWLRLT